MGRFVRGMRIAQQSRMQTNTGDTNDYERLVRKLGEASVRKHFDAYADVPWNDPDHRIDLDDPRFELDDDEPLGGTDWYRSLPQHRRSQIGLHMVASRMHTGIDFEGILSRGLLELASARRCGSAEMRYAYHEVIEESQHSLMFQELVHRIGMPTDGISAFERWASRSVPRLGRTFPECFFVHVLAGEAPVDQLQRRMLERKRALHPLLRRIMQIHVTEEARHICFAEQFLDRNVPCLGPVKALRLAVTTPFVVATTVGTMMRTPRDVVRAHAIPRSVVREAEASERHAIQVEEGVAPIRALMARLGVLDARTAPLWRWLGLLPRAKEPLLLAAGPNTHAFSRR
jgi:hypothetical protein